MAHFARLDENNFILEVYPITDSNCLDSNGNESEEVGINYCQQFFNKVYGSNTKWKQTSYNRKIRKNYAGIGYFYSEELDAFIPPKPYPSWILNTEICDWDSPIPQPKLTEEQKESRSYYDWNEETEEWELKTVT
jgi:hypothetical protein